MLEIGTKLAHSRCSFSVSVLPIVKPTIRLNLKEKSAYIINVRPKMASIRRMVLQSLAVITPNCAYLFSDRFGLTIGLLDLILNTNGHWLEIPIVSICGYFHAPKVFHKISLILRLKSLANRDLT